MGIAETEVVKQQAAHADREYDRQPAVIRRVPKQREEVAVSGRAQHQQRNGNQQGDLGQAHELDRVEAPCGEKGKGLLDRQQEAGEHRKQDSESVIDRGRGAGYVRGHVRDADLSLGSLARSKQEPRERRSTTRLAD